MTQNESVVELLNKYHKSPITHKLRDKFLTPSIFDIIQKDRSETVHSNFLKWIFELQLSNGIKGYNIISSLLQVAYTRALEQGKQDYFSTHLAKAAYGNPVNIQLSNEVEREYPCPGVYYTNDQKYNSGIVDIVISGTISQENQIKPFKIIIENKVDTKEHDLQTWKYFTYFERKTVSDTPDDIVIQEKLYNSPENELRVYLFLTPESNPINATCDCNHFIKINYQDIMEHCIVPLLQSSQLDSHTRLVLEEYSRALSLPYINNIGKTIIMSLSPTDADLLKEFWEANQSLITMSLQALGQTTQDDEEIQNTLKAINNLNSSIKKYSITHIATNNTIPTNQSNLMYDLMNAYKKYTNKCGKDIVNRYGAIGSVFCTEDDKTGYSKASITFNDGTKRRVTTQIQRNAEKLKKIKDIAEKDGFLIK
ncbi:MAG: PD-(D/E)XK nuclease family protein [Muribaculum sp.]|nr:PD-(D/E)XK nuclease family protein [Muribaculum sp.]